MSIRELIRLLQEYMAKGNLESESPIFMQTNEIPTIVQDARVEFYNQKRGYYLLLSNKKPEEQINHKEE